MEQAISRCSLRISERRLLWWKCRYVGYICQNGKAYELVQGSDKSAKDALARLLEPLGVTLNDASYFAPLTRGFFDSAP